MTATEVLRRQQERRQRENAMMQRWAEELAYESARTPLGAKLRRLRARIIESGEPLLSWEAIEREVAVRRGEAEHHK